MILKFFLHISKDEQRRRFLNRLDEPEKNWKFSVADVKERERWRPWIVVPANKKWFARWVVAAATIDALDQLKLKFPTVSKQRRQELMAARSSLASS